MTARVRLLKRNELGELLDLYQYLNPDDPLLAADGKLQQHYDEILADPDYYYYVIGENGILVSSCCLTIIKNLTRSARPYALIENVVTHPNYRQRGYGTAILNKAVETAKERNCYKVMLMTGRKDEGVLRFYEKAGFNQGEKTGFIMRWDLNRD